MVRLTKDLWRRGAERDASGFDRRLVAPMVLGSVLNPVNSSIIAISLVPIGRDLGAAPSQTAWLISSLYVATAIGQPVVGRLVDRFGPRAPYLVGTAMVGAAGVLGMLAPGLGWLVVARVVLGLGTCAGYPASMHLIRREAQRTGRDSPNGILTTLAVANQTVAVIGPTLGGLLIGVGGWRATFAVNLPLSVACLVLGATRLPRGTGALSTPRRESTLPRPGRRDVLGPLGVVRGNRPLGLTYVRMLLTAVVSYSVLYGFTQWLEEGRGLAPSQAGLLLLPMFGTAIIVSTLTGRHAAVRGKLVVGGVLQVVAAVLMLALGGHSAIWLLVVLVLLLGVPQGLLNLANQNAVYHQADPDRLGASAGLLRTFMYLGAIAASAATGHFLGASADSDGLHEIAGFAAVAAALMLVVTLADRSLSAIGHPRNEGEPVPLSTLDETPALVVIDLQKGILASPAAHDLDDVVRRSGDLAAAFRARGLPVVLVNVTGGAPGRTDAQQAGAPRPAFSADFAELVAGLDVQPEDELVTKQTWGAFAGTSLESYLRSRGATQVVLTGVATSAGVESTARFAHELGFNVVLVSDAMSDRSAAAHDHSVSHVFPRIGEVTTTAELLAALPEPARP
ncbi:MFS transporter [Intrasporangium sp. YIM S08009]|uniref:MFS transporter n=1 Tax=Intrasporangium zincisolvens TaxID=3080018 RepID=UPI002B05CF57|nr:MFS transporter [Intrasporangium sp. YIM S08009]